MSTLSDPAIASRQRSWALLLLAIGTGYWFHFVQANELGLYRRGKLQWNWPPLYAIVVAMVCLVRPLRNALLAPLDQIRTPTTAARTRIAFLLFIGSASYFVLMGYLQHRDFQPRNHDEHMYLLQARMLASGRLWMPQHAVPDFFETFHVLVRPKYAAIYFPGTALLYVPSLWLGLPAWITSVLISSSIVALTYRIITEAIDGSAGFLSSIGLMTLPRFRLLSLMVMSHTVVLLLGLLMTWALFRWQKEETHRKRLRFATLFGLLAGWAAITRPLDALCFALPLGVVFLLDLRYRRGERFSSIIRFILAAAPLLALQLVADRGITGHLGQTPATLYANKYWPVLNLGFHPYDPAAHPPTALPQILDYYRDFIVRRVKQHQPGRVIHTLLHDRLPMTLAATLPSALLMILLLTGILGLADRRRIAIAAVLPLLLLAYVPFLFYLPHYTLMAAPAVLLLTFLGGQAIARTFPSSGSYVRALVAGLMLVFSAVNAIGYAHDSRDATPFSHVLADVRQKLAAIRQPSVVLFKYQAGDNYLEEPVYNLDVADVDRALVIRAHDLGSRNREIFAYYGQVAPDRVFYRYERPIDGRPSNLVKLGTARQLAAGSPGEP